MNLVVKAWAYFLATLGLAFLLTLVFSPEYISARNINEYKDTISNSIPGAASNHTLSFKLGTTINPGAYIEITPPSGFIVSSSSLLSHQKLQTQSGVFGGLIKVTPDPVNPGTTLTLTGYTQPNALVTLENEKDKSAGSRQTLTATANGDGLWTTTLSTGNFTVGTYKVRARSEQTGGVSANFSNYTLYGVGQSAS